MKKLTQWLAVTAVAASLVSSTSNLSAQDTPPGGGQGGERGGRGRGGPGGGDFDPAEFQARMMQGIRERLVVKDDTEWKAIEGLVQKVMDARRDIGFGGGGRMFGRPGGGGVGGGNNDGGRRRGGFFGEPDPTQEALDKAIESKASKEELKSAMAKVRASKKEKEAKLAKAQDDLKKVLTTEQEATALSMGLVQ